MRKPVYAVYVNREPANVAELSRYFNTKRAATNWAKWLATRAYVSTVQIWLGGSGGELVAEFHK